LGTVSELRDGPRQRQRAHVIAFLLGCFRRTPQPAQRLLGVTAPPERSGGFQRKGHITRIIGLR
jgi:hypothetical protein